MNDRGSWSSVAFMKCPNSSTGFIKGCSCSSGSPDTATSAVQIWSFIGNLQHDCIKRVAISAAYLLSGVLNMIKHSSRLILKIFNFMISSTSELVLRNKIRFVARIHVESVDLTIALLLIILSRKCSFSSPSGYCVFFFNGFSNYFQFSLCQ